MGAADFSLVPGFACAVGEKGKKRGQNTKNMGERGAPSGRPEVATLSPLQITSRYASLAYFSSNGEAGPGFKYEFINRLPLPRFFFQVLVNEQEENIQRR